MLRVAIAVNSSTSGSITEYCVFRVPWGIYKKVFHHRGCAFCAHVKILSEPKSQSEYILINHLLHQVNDLTEDNVKLMPELSDQVTV